MPELGVNVDHVATLREARRAVEPDPVWAAASAVLGGADAITIHLREDRRHIQDRDLRLIRETCAVRLNLELAANDAILEIACRSRPDQATLVPERREELTTEGGLDLSARREAVRDAIERLRNAGILVSLFLDPDPRQIEIAAELRADAVELHTGQYAHAPAAERQARLHDLIQASAMIRRVGIQLHAGHGLNYHNVGPVARIADMHELNIGHAIVARSVFVGLEQAVREMRARIRER
ncbi:MAG: pyridoxine 5'-phosphate synthase [Planctomycetes bacterium]|nr:pyridoxine 5'-phosphate synthase [Planctomycetota bacterium]